MSTTSVTPLTSSNPDVASGVAQFLSPVVVEMTALAVNGKQAHWHVRGANFIGIHELLDSVVAHAIEWADLAAERVVALGLPVDARIQTVASGTRSEPLTPGFRRSEDVIVEIIRQMDIGIATVNLAIAELAEIDASSQDVAIEIGRGLEKDRWFLFAHVSES
ncbi:MULTISPECIES: Dps family protein [unclassified Rathayibacter]|uniref:Dps family protein n=1 Tax=unclassified Rathayibacter TaxID=2609250 RepID=UPI00188BC8DC|nr:MULTISPECIES: DNA starvation/stationary phase protection protein [unclassified Rathayibacter]MBF4462234.1 DNA starvation/stationary phase protection protein [Rathayibacter sp. VKM Ac-2879]MBF4503723.1 DNA starvation/stationary phase protection protein [Rathayibacter sp. VKM Ac-2878]